MLLRTLFVTILLAALAEAIVGGVHALAQAALRRQALVAVHDELLAGATLARSAVAQAIENGADPRRLVPVAPSPIPECRLRVGDACAIQGVARIAFDAPGLGGGASPSPCPSGACTIYEQENDAVWEGRIGATISADALGPNGALLASRRSRVTFRTMRAPPYAAPAGYADASTGDVNGPLQTGDDGGSAGGLSAPGTLIDVLYQNALTGAAMPANVWRSQVQSGIATSRPWSP